MPEKPKAEIRIDYPDGRTVFFRGTLTTAALSRCSRGRSGTTTDTEIILTLGDDCEKETRKKDE